MQTGRPEKAVSLVVQFSETEWDLLIEKVGDHQPGAEAQFIHDTVVNRLKRKPRIKEDVQT